MFVGEESVVVAVFVQGFLFGQRHELFGSIAYVFAVHGKEEIDFRVVPTPTKIFKVGRVVVVQFFDVEVEVFLLLQLLKVFPEFFATSNLHA